MASERGRFSSIELGQCIKTEYPTLSARLFCMTPTTNQPTYNPAPSYRENPELYSSTPTVRLDAAFTFQRSNPEFRLRWPFGHWGAANPWLVLLGPSPGNDRKRNRVATSDPYDETHVVGYGPDAREIVFEDGARKRRNQNWNLLRLAAFDAALNNSELAERCQSKLTAVMNLGFETAATAARDSEHDARRVRAFSRTLLPCMADARPCVVVVLSKAAWDPFEQALIDTGRVVVAFDAAANPTPSRTRKPMKRLLARLCEDLPYPTAVILSPVHPYMGFARGVDDQAIVEPLRELLSAQQQFLGLK